MHELMHEFRGEILRSVQCNGLALVDQHTQCASILPRHLHSHAWFTFLFAGFGQSFFWVTAAFTNATLRLFPLVMDIVRAIEKTTPFSDQGDVVIAITTNPAARAILLLGIFSGFFSLAVVVARGYSFEKHRAAKSVGIYLLSLAVGIAVLLIDEMLH
jgi:hypothetical protein